MHTKISVIIPVYNSQDYLNNCIDSILNQSYTNFEVLLIDDGSLDTSLSICRHYAEIDIRVRVFQKSNSGPSDARNVGMDNATGDFIIFVDSDDAIDIHLFERMLSHINDKNDAGQTECVGVNYLRFHSIGELNNSNLTTANNDIVRAKEFFCARGGLFVWGILYNRKIIEKYNLRFDSCLDYCEDVAFNSEASLESVGR